MKIQIAAVLVFLALSQGAQGVEAPETATLGLLREAKATQYAVKEKYGSGIDSMTIGYDKEGTPVIGIATRETKTYKKVITLIAVKPDETKYRIHLAKITNPEKLPGKSRTMAGDALKDITGKIFPDENSTKSMVDAMTGASKYYKAIYVSYALMSSRVIKEMKAKPDWPKQPVPAEK